MPHVSTMRRKSSTGPAAIGDAYGGGYYAGQTSYGGNTYAIVVAPKTGGDIASNLATSNTNVNAFSDNDSAANTVAISTLSAGGARTIDNLTLGGFTDWQVPSKAVLAIISANLKPTITTLPAIFKTGGAQALNSASYWSSTAYNWVRDDSHYEEIPIYETQPYSGSFESTWTETFPSLPCPNNSVISSSLVYVYSIDEWVEGGVTYHTTGWDCEGTQQVVVDYEQGDWIEQYTQLYQAYRQNPVTGTVDYVNKSTSSRIRAVRLVPI